MAYRDNVDLAATALVRGEDAHWELAQLTFENTYEGHGGREREGRVAMAAWCGDVRDASKRDFGLTTGFLYKAIWREVLQRPEVPRPPWAEAYKAATQTQRQGERDETPRDEAPPAERAAQRAYDDLAAQVYEAPPEHREYLFRRLAGDPEITARAAEIGSPISRAVTGLEQRAELVRRRRHEQMIQADPIARRLEQNAAVNDLMSACDQYARESERFAERVADLLRHGGLPTEDRLFWIREAAERLRAVLARLEAYTDGGRTDLDAFLDTVLTGGGDG